LDVTEDVVIVNAADTEAPAPTVTDAGTVTPALLLAKATTAPPAAAGPFSVTVLAVVDPPPTTVFGDNVTADTPAGCTVRPVLTVTPL
jgi:hypothetical protein